MTGATNLERGLVVRSQAGFYAVHPEGKAEHEPIMCRLRGKLKRGPRRGDLVAVGDWVQFRRLPDGTGLIEKIEPRQRALSRMAPGPRGEYEQVIIANPDQVVFVFACANPQPKLRMLDRFLVVAEKQEIPALIVANKVDLVPMEQAQALFARYAEIGYPVLYTSVVTGQGLEDLKARLQQKISALAGPSGVGKSSLLNAIQPGLGLVVREVSRATGEGRHTTVVREMFPLEGGGYVADTPGLKAFSLWDVEPEELDAYFPEMRDLVAECEFSDCTHIHEPGCAVRRAVEEGRIHPERYQSYVRLRLELAQGLERVDLID
ncbi:MAG TPA: ribosome small subunit-dependent GTPase A [Anaerolineae bacterium]|nr:ribosome small subunit-dependent GTPase A [Anaerolineae bacterium]HID83521.1 ribosome small subunit-dependent GTPase A [Anaerolineales bacterium]HIQ08802.1 ribosome small subunit-dependent GTPase A [Anaerolineaceae bacterium]